MDFEQEIRTLIQAAYPLIYVESAEEGRALEILNRVSQALGKTLMVWTVSGGLRPFPDEHPEPDTELPFQVLNRIAAGASRESAVHVLVDFHPYLREADIVRKLKDVAFRLERASSALILLSVGAYVPPELEKLTTILALPLPTRSELSALIDQYEKTYSDSATFALDNGTREVLVDALLGLTRTEAANVLSRAIIHDRRLDASDVPLILKEKEQIVRRSRVLEYFPLNESMEQVGGLDLLKNWLSKKRAAFDQRAREFGLDMPKGLLLIGVPGCGKSLVSKAVAASWNMPLLRFDVGRVFDSLVGQSEGNIRAALRVAESVAPCVLWIDEIEKSFGGVGRSDLDSGVSSRVFGTLITWMNEKTQPVFIVATANNIHNLPPELVRKGRFDEVFFVDLPSHAERRDIFAVHLAKRRRDTDAFDLEALARDTRGFSGSDIEAVVRSALEMAFCDNAQPLTQAHLTAARLEIVPLETTMAEQIADLREWANVRARPASSQPTVDPPESRRSDPE